MVETARLPEAIKAPLRALRDRLRELDPRRLRRERRFRRWNSGLDTSRMVLRPGLELTVDVRARAGFEHFCYRDFDMVREFDAFLDSRGHFRRLLDVGACHGLFALAFTHHRPEAVAVAVDPSPLAGEVLQCNLARNPECRVTAVQAALGGRPGKVRMRANWHHLEALGADESPAGSEEVPVETLDGLCARLDFRPDLLKIDVEGYEQEVLLGAPDTLSSRPMIFLELHPPRIAALGGSLPAIEELLRHAGYAIRSGRGDASVLRGLSGLTHTTRVLCRPREAA